MKTVLVPSEETVSLAEGATLQPEISETLDGEPRALDPRVRVVSKSPEVATIGEGFTLHALTAGTTTVELLAPSGAVADSFHLEVAHTYTGRCLSLTMNPGVLEVQMGAPTGYTVSGLIDDESGTVVSGLETSADLVFTRSAGDSTLAFAKGAANLLEGGTTASYSVRFVDPTLEAPSFTPGQLEVAVRHPRVQSIEPVLGGNSAKVIPEGFRAMLEVWATFEPVNGVSVTRRLSTEEYEVGGSTYPNFQSGTSAVFGITPYFRYLVNNGFKPAGTTQTVTVTLLAGLEFVPTADPTFVVTVVPAPTSQDLSVKFTHHDDGPDGRTLAIGNARELWVLAQTAQGPFRIAEENVQSISGGPFTWLHSFRTGYPWVKAGASPTTSPGPGPDGHADASSMASTSSPPSRPARSPYRPAAQTKWMETCPRRAQG